jgi:cytidine deaminase
MSIETTDSVLVEAAIQVRKNAYAPYSHYCVGSALLTRSGKIFTGANVENAVLPLTNCAERTALFQAVSAGEKEFVSIAVVTENFGMPCGSCRQVLAEFGLDIRVIIANTQGEIQQVLPLHELLPHAFTSSDLI